MEKHQAEGKPACWPSDERDKLPSMLAYIRTLIDATLFLPFTIHTADGRAFPVPT